jgi:hypothetical protein
MVPGVSGLEVTPAGPGDEDTVLGLLRAASAARAASGQVTWGGEFPDVVRDLPAGLVHLGRVDGRAAGAFVLRWTDENAWGPDAGDVENVPRQSKPGFRFARRYQRPA